MPTFWLEDGTPIPWVPRPLTLTRIDEERPCPICGEPGCTTCEEELYGEGEGGWDEEEELPC